jgi:protein phosphatase
VADEPRLAVESIAGQRPYQEDSVIAQRLSDGRLLVAVADGMGGHAAGEVASALALETLISALESGKELDAAVVHANAQVHEMAREPGKQGMGTTLVAALVEDGEYMVANVGDSRGYLLKDDGIRKITEDHSFVAEAVKRGQSEEEAMRSPFRDALTRSIGTESQVEVDVFGPFPVRDDSALILCSDGLYKTLSDEDVFEIYAGSSDPDAAAQTLVSQALDRGSDDNISVAIAEYGHVPRAGDIPAPAEADEAGEAQGDTPSSPEPAAAAPGSGAAATLVDMPPLEGPPGGGGGTEPSAATAAAVSTPEEETASDEDSGPPMAVIGMLAVAAAALLAWLIL